MDTIRWDLKGLGVPIHALVARVLPKLGAA